MVIRKRCSAEYSFAWLSFERLPSREAHLLPDTTEAFIFPSFIRRLAASEAQYEVAA